MKAVMISIKPQWCELIASGKKTVEVRKTRPKLETPFKCYIYCTKPKRIYEDIISAPTTKDTYLYAGGKIIGEFVCDDIFTVELPLTIPKNNTVDFFLCLSYAQMELLDFYQYSKECNKIYFWHISDLVIYDKPKPINAFRKPCKYGEKTEISHSCFECGRLGGHWDEKYCCVYLTRSPQSWCYVEV